MSQINELHGTDSLALFKLQLYAHRLNWVPRIILMWEPRADLLTDHVPTC